MAPSDRITPRVCLLVVALAAALGLGGLACENRSEPDPRLREKRLLFDGEALRRLLALAAQLDETPIARAARSWQPAVADCAAVSALLDTPDPTPDCVDSGGLDEAQLAFLRRIRGDADGLLLWPLGEDGRVALRFRVDIDGGVEIDGELQPPSGVASWQLLVPADEAPAASVLASAGAFVHVRGRPAGGLGLAALMPDGGQADRLFALKGRLLEGALLAGTWELAILPPAPDGSLPLPVGALHHRAAAPVEHALAEALDQLEATWPIRRAPRSFTLANGSKIEGGCFPELPLLPELAPCWVVTPRAFLIAYRGEALDAVLAAPPVASPPPTEDKMSAAGTMAVAHTASGARAASGAHAAFGAHESSTTDTPSVEDTTPSAHATSVADAPRARTPGESLRVELGRMARHSRAENPDATRAHPGDLFSRLLVDLRAGTTTPVALRARLERAAPLVGQVAP